MHLHELLCVPLPWALVLLRSRRRIITSFPANLGLIRCLVIVVPHACGSVCAARAHSCVRVLRVRFENQHLAQLCAWSPTGGPADVYTVSKHVSFCAAHSCLHSSTIRSFADLTGRIIRPTVVLIFKTRSFSRVSKAYFGLIWPVEPNYVLKTCQEVAQHSSLEIVVLVSKVYRATMPAFSSYAAPAQASCRPT